MVTVIAGRISTEVIMKTGGVYEVDLPDKEMRSECWSRQVSREV